MKINQIKSKNILAQLLKPIAAIAAAMVVGAFLILYAGANPIKAYQSLLTGAFGSFYNFTEVLVKASPLWLAGLGVAISFKAGIFNVGAEGQIMMGALATAWIGVVLGSLPMVILLPVTMLAAVLAGGIWASIPGMMKAKLGVDEIITTIMFNYIATWVVSYFVTGPLKDPAGVNPQTAELGAGAQLPILVKATRLHAGLILTLLLIVVMYFVMKKSTFGYKVRLLGSSLTVARASGINVPVTLVTTMIISGGLSGLAGMMEISGLHHRLLNSFSPGYGFTAVVVALLGNLNPMAVFVSGFFFAAMTVGANEMQRSVAIPTSLISVIQGLIVFFVLVSEVKNLSLPRLFGAKKESREVAE